MTLAASRDIASADRWSVEQSIHHCFLAQAWRCPDGVAVIDRASQRTYAQLSRDASAIAARIVATGVARGDRIAIVMRHGGELVAAILGSLMAGGIVVVLNPADTTSRLLDTLDDSGATAILSDAAHEALAQRIAGGRQVVRVDQSAPSPSSSVDAVPSSPDDVAFLVYTSGSTGRPKGVMQSHRMVLHNALRLSIGMHLRPDDRISLLASPAAGQGVSTIWCALLNGATLCPFALAEHGATSLAKWIHESAISVLIASSSVFRRLVQAFDARTRLPGVRLVRLASEPATSADLAAVHRHFGESCVLLNSLSSSETGNILQAAFQNGEKVSDGRLRVGWPAPGIEVRVLDDQGCEAKAGDVGEIEVRSHYLSHGYWRDPTLTAGRFDFSGPHSGTIYRSGDLARRLDDGSLIFVGRNDARVKVRGNRVEPTEVEDFLRRHPAIEDAAVVARCNEGGETQLVAFVVVRSGHAESDAAVRRSLRESLPARMSPAQWTFLDHMPLTAGGKIDRERLRQMLVDAPQRSSLATPAIEPPLTDTEASLAVIWSKALHGRRIGRSDDFFDIGGDSLAAAVVVAHIHASLGVAIDMQAFASAASLEEQAALIDRLQGDQLDADLPPMVRIERSGPLPLSFSQERIWRYSRTPDTSGGYTMSFSHILRGPLDVDSLRWCVNQLIDRHESLRTTFVEVGGEPRQIVHPSACFDIPLLDFSPRTDPKAHAYRLFELEIRRPFDLSMLPLVRMIVVRLGDDEHLLLRMNHHIISDRWSWHVFFEELALLYASRVQGREPPALEPLNLQMVDYADWQRNAMGPDTAAWRADVAWWSRVLGGQPPHSLDMPCRRAVPSPDAQPDDGYFLWGLDQHDSHRLDEAARNEGITHFSARLAAFVALSAMETGATDLALGTYLTQRQRVETQKMFGFFSSLAILRLQFDPAMKFCTWMAQVQRTVREAQAHGSIPHEHLCEELRRGGVNPPHLQTMFSTIDQGQTMQFGGVKMTWLERRVRTMPWGFTLCFNRHQEQSQCYAAFDARIYDPAAVQRMIDRLRRFIRAAGDAPHESCASVWAASRRSGG